MTKSKWNQRNRATKYDAKFATVKDYKWRPWVGKHYDDTGIFILGMNTDARENSGSWKRIANRMTDTGEMFFDFEKYGRVDKPFNVTVKMFCSKGQGGADMADNLQTVKLFWSSVAFMNFHQAVVADKGATPSRPIVEQSQRAFDETLRIIKPTLCLIWGVLLMDDMNIEGAGKCAKKIGTVKPRVAKADGERPPIIGIKHPSMPMITADWRKFLLTHPASKEPVTKFIEHLRNHPTK